MSFHLGRKLMLSWAAMATGLLSGMALYRLQLAALGPARLGIYVAISAACAYLALLELGLSAALNRHVAAADLSKAGADSGFHSLLATALRLYLGIAALALLAGAALSGALQPLLRVPPELRAETRALPVILALDVAVALLGGALRGIINGRGHSEVTSTITLLRHLCYSALCVFMLRRGVGLQGLSFGLLGCDLLAGVALWLALPSAGVAPLSALRARPRRVHLRTLGAFSIVATLAYGGQLLLRQAALPLVARALGPAAVVGYAAAGRLALVFFMLMTHTGSVLTPLLAAALARGQLAPGAALATAGRLGLCVGAPPLVALLALAEPLLGGWLGPAFQDHAPVLHLMGLGLLAQLIGLGGDVNHYASGGHLGYALLKLGAGVAAVVAVLGGVGLYGAQGAALANALVVLLCDAVLTPLFLTHALAAGTLTGYYAALLRRGAALFALLPLALLLKKLGPACTSLTLTLPLAGAAAIVGWAVLFARYLTPDERALILGRALPAAPGGAV